MRFRVLSMGLLALTVVGCSYINGPVKEVEAYGAAIEPFMEELSKTVAADPSEAGIEKAAKLWESKKPDLKGKLDAIDAAPQGKNADWRSLQMKINSRTREHLDSISAKVGGSPAESKFKQLRQDIDTTLKLK